MRFANGLYSIYMPVLGLVALIIVESLLLYFVARRLTEAIFGITMFTTKSKKIGVTVLSLILFPGTIVHELAHLFTAEIMGVRTGKLTLAPDSLADNELRTGSVAIQQTDPFRRFLIGVAPVFWGTGALFILSYFFKTIAGDALSTGSIDPIFTWPTWLYLVLLLYGSFSVSTTMFSSKEDMKGSLPVIILAILVLVTLYILGIRVVLTGKITEILWTILTGLAQSFTVILALNSLCLLLLTFWIAGIRKNKI